MVAAGNAIVFNTHPNAKRVSAWFIDALNGAVEAVGGSGEPLQLRRRADDRVGQHLMKHPGIRLIVVTGGGAVVKAAMTCGKRAIAAGPGNPPVVVDETADIAKAGRDIVFGASLDNNIICIVEKEIIAVADIADMLKRELSSNRAVEIKAGYQAVGEAAHHAGQPRPARLHRQECCPHRCATPASGCPTRPACSSPRSTRSTPSYSTRC
jgi:acyl-CoA reductase-like NAD-dependent aldehyde dehydrogenase